ncbi:cytochrome P450 [Aspergillus fijiensis CBS 313.89]|uniref:N-alkane-inducible cytochrome P450 n=1 Tax=Aspergillus fijiensis CBS 313.89 TaxID=1448319 RepID=A0A8G1W291_9EURO|nr:n-alkane-inducible cytochrome P450 [Aspergillus fijiensis CBS 313.89]RAK80221.1 n-alkane-inducible cytochrome P450 [Aspergillus fijiensis CBS 313.89]
MESLLNVPPTRIALCLLLLTLTSILLLTRIHRAHIRRRFAHQHGCQPITHYNNKDPILGLDEIYRGITTVKRHKALESITQRFQLHGNTFASRRLLKYTIVTIEPENIKTILSTRFKDYGLAHRLPIFQPLLGQGIFDTDGAHWAASRALIRPSFTKDQVADLAAFESLIPSLLAHLPRDGATAVDLQDLFFRYTIDSATDFLFGQSVGSLKMQRSELDFAEAFNYAQEAMTVRAILGPFGRFYYDQKAERCNRVCREFAMPFVEEAVRAVQDGGGGGSGRKNEKYIFSHELASRTSDKRRILDELMNVLLAGRDTTASLLSNMFFMLAKHPEVWAKLRQEVVTKLEGRLPSYEELRGLRYLRYCVNESLRLHPVVPMNDRVAVRDTVLPVGGGKDGLSPVFVPKDTIVAYNVYAMHRRKDFYGDDAEVYRPERWEDGRLQPRWEYLPFNGGPRICIGQQYALTEVAYVTVRLAQEFEGLESRDLGPWEESLTLTVCSRNGTRVCLRPA